MPAATLPERIRPDFPALRREWRGKTLAYLDGPAGSQLPRPVIERVTDYLAHHNANTQGFFPTTRETDQILSEAREHLAAFLGADSPREIVFGANMTTLTFWLSRALAREWREGDELVVTELDHQANVEPWRQAAGERGMGVRIVPFHRDTLTLDYEALDAAISSRTRLVAIGYASNAVGTINDVERAVAAAREVGAYSFVDAVHYAPHRPIDVQALGCDFLACSAYKFFGPHVGVLWGRQPLLEELPVIKLPPAPAVAPERWETGTLNHEGIAGAGAAVEWIAGLGENSGSLRERVLAGMETIRAHESPLFRRLLSGLQEIPGVRIYGPPADAPRTPTVGFTVRGRDADEVAQRLADEGVCVWSGDFYASTVVDGLGLRERGGLVRAGIAPYVIGEDVERLLDGTRRLARES